MKFSKKTIQASLTGALCLGLFSGCTNGNFKSRKATPAEVLEWQQKNGGAGDTAPEAADSEELPETAETETPTPGGETTPSTETPAPAAPTQVVGTETKIPFIPKDHAQGSMINEPSMMANTAELIATNDQLLTGEKNAETAALIRALTITATGGQGQASLAIEAVVIVKSGPGQVAERLLRISNALISSTDKEVGFLPLSLAKDVYDKVGVIPGTTIRVSAVCKDECKTIQVLMIFESSDDSQKFASALFVLQQTDGENYGLSADTNLAVDLSKIPSFDSYITAKAAEGVETPSEVVQQTAAPKAATGMTWTSDAIANWQAQQAAKAAAPVGTVTAAKPAAPLVSEETVNAVAAASVKKRMAAQAEANAAAAKEAARKKGEAYAKKAIEDNRTWSQKGEKI